jgi:RNase adapter protein RapZ
VKKLKIIIITGLSGSGKSTAISAFEDAGFYCVDNMPVALLPKFLELPIESDSEIAGLAFVMDLREKSFLSRYPFVFDSLKEKGYGFKILFLEADEETLLKRYSQTRRHHPLSQDKSLLEGIRIEQEQLKDLKITADKIIDTSRYNVHNLKSVINYIAQQSKNFAPMKINILSFGFKYGTPHDASLIMDVRFLANPYFVPELKALNGRSADIKNYVLNNDEARRFFKKYLDLLDYLIPLYEKEGKSYLTIAVGCTGGRHRSVSITEAIFEHIKKPGRQIIITHRDINL